MRRKAQSVLATASANGSSFLGEGRLCGNAQTAESRQIGGSAPDKSFVIFYCVQENANRHSVTLHKHNSLSGSSKVGKCPLHMRETRLYVFLFRLLLSDSAISLHGNPSRVNPLTVKTREAEDNAVCPLAW